MALAWWLVPCLPFPGLPHIYFLFTVRLRIFHVCRNENFRNSYLSFYWKKWFYIWYMALAWWLVPCLPFPGLPHIYFLFTVRLRIFHVCRNENFRNGYLSFYWKKWFYIWYMALAWWLVPCLPFPGLPHIYFLFTVRLTNEWVGVFLARRSVQHLVFYLQLTQIKIMRPYYYSGSWFFFKSRKMYQMFIYRGKSTFSTRFISFKNVCKMQDLA